MGALIENLRETHQLGASTREWLVSDSAAPGFGAPHQRVVGHTEARAGYHFVRHDPAFTTLLITEHGEGLVALDDAWVPCPADHAYLMPAHSAAAYRIRSGTTWRLHWVIHFEPARLPGLPPGSPPRLVRCEAAGLRRAIEELCREHSGRAEPSVLGLWGSLVDRLTQRLLDPQALDPRLDRLWARVHDDIGSPWDMDRLARAAAMSPENLRRLCVRQLGRPPMAHLAQLRMQAAAAALLHSNEKLDALAARFGYGDAFAFSTAFKRIMGRSPRQFRAKGEAARGPAV
ncbi:MAG TPA: AraC family transcriptional regulator [Opitutaceae bacterium]|nr:AraC family transcriptional regulator [Opitutaceae bacterium]